MFFIELFKNPGNKSKKKNQWPEIWKSEENYC